MEGYGKSRVEGGVEKVMARAEREMPPLDTFPGLLLTLTALSGEFPTDLLARLPGAASYKEFALKQLKRENLLRTYYRDGVRGLRLTFPAKKLLLSSRPHWFGPYLSGAAETNRLKSEIIRRLRLHRMAEVLVSMLNAGVTVFPWEKPGMFQSVPPPAHTWISHPTYFSSREVKEIGPQRDMIRGSRSTGVLLTGGDIFVVYNTGVSEMKWEFRAELRLKNLLKTDLCHARLSHQFMNTEQSAIVFGADMGRMEPLMGAHGQKGHDYFVLDGDFTHFYYLTSDHYGEVVLQLLCGPDERAALDAVLLEDLSESRPGLVVENDAMDGDEPVLFGYTCDMPRIKRFDNALHIHNTKGTLYCFDFQEDALRKLCGPNVSIRVIDFDAYEESVFHSAQEID